MVYGLSGSGKTYASKYLKKLINNSFIIDGDEIRKNISFDLNYTLIDRKLQVKRVLGLAKICIDQNLYPIISTVYFDKKLQKELKKVRIKLVEIIRNDEIVNYKLKNYLNVISKDISQEDIECNKIINDRKFKYRLNEFIFYEKYKNKLGLFTTCKKL